MASAPTASVLNRHHNKVSLAFFTARTITTVCEPASSVVWQVPAPYAPMFVSSCFWRLSSRADSHAGNFQLKLPFSLSRLGIGPEAQLSLEGVWGSLNLRRGTEKHI
ncbi:hypothetical protein FRC08_018456 [Ceratobasidium sp. 394]|nr:hypothetical protein FRC08_018456 [Ceratobasidium sp. 394]